MESNMRANGDGPRHFESLQLTHLPPLRKREDSELRQNLRASAPSARRICKSSKKEVTAFVILNCGQVTRTIPQLSNIFPMPTTWMFSGLKSSR
ncbi:hypothetical protein TNCV_2607271 [Trichonephila clavipes]|uniref:Uncharacterized protein n=1 Tax=Trichonephila clavipes TaxID=2585209 RepID=A0A8X6RYK3_TRICX|nr:hypothetical protein TNCV_2607271 [Trichonephila clavipes]